MNLLEVTLDADSRGAITQLAQALAERGRYVPESVVDAAVANRARLPPRVLDLAAALTRQRGEVLLMRGAFDVSREPPTPLALPTRRKAELSRLDAMFVALAAAFGKAFGWSSIQHGSIVNDVFPIEAHAASPRSSGYKIGFDLHTEDAFRPDCGRYLALLCVRNSERISTRLVSVGDIALSSEDEAELRAPQFRLGANIGHDTDSTATCLQSIVFGSRTYPFFRINMNVEADRHLRPSARQAVARVHAALRAACSTIELTPGDVVVLDNYRIAHGRGPYEPAAWGEGRWFKRLYLARGVE